MTDAELLAEAVEKLKVADRMLVTNPDYVLAEVSIVNSGQGYFCAYPRVNGVTDASVRLAKHPSAIECCQLALAKLAAERAEAAKSEREKRLEQAMRTIVALYDKNGECLSSLAFGADIARKALES